MSVADVLEQYPMLKPGSTRTQWVLTDEDKLAAIKEDLME